MVIRVVPVVRVPMKLRLSRRPSASVSCVLMMVRVPPYLLLLLRSAGTGTIRWLKIGVASALSSVSPMNLLRAVGWR